jgi:NTP pyrophosphatase (non-canonical NTP hydrolase)
MYMSDSNDRVIFLGLAIRHFFKLIRKGETNKSALEAAVASVLSRECTLAAAFHYLPVVEAMCEKYPSDHCTYCGSTLCSCPPIRPAGQKPVLAAVNQEQLNWTISEWVQHFDRKYGKSNRERGIQFALSRLFEEFGEVQEAHYLGIYDRSLNLTQLRRSLSLEFADVIAWTLSIAGLLDLNIEPIFEKRYGGVHKRCGKNPCDCGPFQIYQNDPVERANSITVPTPP